MSFRDKRSRYQCYASRDRYWECLDTVPTTYERQEGPSGGSGGRAPGGGHQAKYGAQLQPQGDADGALKPCMELRRLCLQSCPEHWMKHFDRKRQYMLFREKVAAVGNMTAAGDVTLISDHSQPSPDLSGQHPQQDKTAIAAADSFHCPSAANGRIPTIQFPDEAQTQDELTHSLSLSQRQRSLTNVLPTLDLDNGQGMNSGDEGYSPLRSLFPLSGSASSTLQKLFKPLPIDSPANETNSTTVGKTAGLLLSLQVQPAYSSSPSPSPSHSPSPSPIGSPSVSPLPSPSTPEAPAADLGALSSLPVRPPPRRHRVYSQVVYRQRLVPTK